MEDISKIFGVEQIEADKAKVLKAIDEVVGKIAEGSSKALSFKVDVQGVTNINEWQKQVQNASNTIVDLQGNLLKLGNATREANELEARAAALKAQHNGSTKDLVGVMKQLEQVEVQSAKAKQENAKADALEIKNTRERNKAKAEEIQQLIKLQKQKDLNDKLLQREQEKARKLNDEYEVLKKNYNDTAKEAMRLAAAYGVDSAEAQKFIIKARDMNTQLVKIEESVGRHQRKVGQYQNATLALSQLIREAPAFANGIQTGLSALSNNFAGLFDQFKILRAEVGSTGKALKILATSFFDFTNIFVLAYAAFEIFGKDLFKTEEGINKTAEAAKNLSSAFESVIDQVTKLQELQKTLNLAAISNVEILKAIEANTVDGLKRKEELIKSIGVVNDAVYEHEKEVLDAGNERREAEIKLLKKKLDISQDIGSALAYAEGDRANLPKYLRMQGNLPESVIKGIEKQFNDAVKAGTNLEKIIDDIRNQNVADGKAIEKQITETEAATQNAIVAFVENRNRLMNQKEKELQKELSATREQLRQETEKEDVASVDKIVADTRAKYKALTDEISKNREIYRLSVTDENNLGYTDKNIQAYDKLLNLLKAIGEQERKNAEYEFSRDEYSRNQKTGVGLLQGAADLASSNAAFGIPSYEQSAAAIDLQTKAKKEALEAQFRGMAATITDSNQIIEAQRQQDEKLKQIDRDAYKQRLKLAEDYFNKISAKVIEATRSLSTNADIGHLERLISIVSGGGNSATRDYATFIEDQRNNRNQAQIGLNGVNQQIPGAAAALQKAKENASGPLSPDYKEEADKQVALSQQVYDDLIRQQKEYELAIANSDDAIRRKKEDDMRHIRDLAVNLIQEVIQAEAQATQQRIQSEQNQIQREQETLRNDTDQKLRAIDATTGYAIDKANEKQQVLAQAQAKEAELQAKSNALALKAAKAQKQAAESSIIANTAVAIIKAFVDFPYPVAVPIAALLAATGAVQYAAAASAPLPEFAKGGTTTTEHFVAGEKGAELMTAPDGSMTIAEKRGIYKMPIGTKINTAEETTRILQAAAARMFITQPMVNPVNDGAIMKELTKYIGNKFEDVGDDMVRAMYGSRPQIPNVSQAYVDAVRTQQNLQFRVKR